MHTLAQHIVVHTYVRLTKSSQFAALAARDLQLELTACDAQLYMCSRDLKRDQLYLVSGEMSIVG